jgi:PAS domain S-box-containing protein
MNLYALLSLCASAISITLGVSVYFLNRKVTPNRLFMLTMFANAYWAFCVFMRSTSDSLDGAVFWGKALFLWPFLMALMLHFALSFIESELLRHRSIYLGLYIPALAFSLIDLLTNWIWSGPILTSWGYEASVSYSVVSRLDGVWAAILAFLIVFIYANYYVHLGDKIKKNQIKFVAVGFGVPIFLALVTDSLFPVMGIAFPVLGSISGIITGVFAVYAMLRYNLFIFTPEIAVENVFSAMPDSVILVDLKGRLIKVNRALVELTGYAENELIGRRIEELMSYANMKNKDGTVPQVIARLSVQREIRNYEVGFNTKCEERCIGSLSCSMVSNNQGIDVGMPLFFMT